MQGWYILVVAEASSQGGRAEGGRATASARRRLAQPDYHVAAYTVRMRHRPPFEMIELSHFDGNYNTFLTAVIYPTR